MKLLSIALAASFVAVAAEAQYHGGYVDNRASTAGEGYMRGFGNVIRSRGQANLMNSAAAVNMTEASKNAMDNRMKWTNTYFEMRQANKASRDAERGPSPTKEDWIRYAQMGAPARLSPSELDHISGKITWPALLQEERFASARAALDKLYAERAQTGAIGHEDYVSVKQTTDAMLDQLKKEIRQIPPSVYTSTKKFVQSLAYEARMPPS